MFTLRKNWFTPHGPTASRRESLPPSFEDAKSIIELEVRRSLAESSKREESPVDLQELRFVLERSKYDQIQQTVQVIYESTDKKDFVQPMLVYHSTQNIDKVNEIIKHGYLLPGQQHPTQLWTLRMQNGNVYGDGIYCSPSFDVSKWYSFLDLQQNIQLIVNILVPGRNLVSSASSSQGFMGPVFESGHDPGVYWRYAEDKDDPYRIDSRVDYHSIRSEDMAVWVSGCPDRIVPVAVATVRPRPHSILMRPFANLSHRRSFLKAGAVTSSYVKFTYIGTHLSLVTPAHKSTLYALHYSNPYTLLLATVLRQRVDMATMCELMKWFMSHAETPAAFLQQQSATNFLKRCAELDIGTDVHDRIKSKLTELSHALVDNHGGLVPRTFEIVESLPGLTFSTAADFFTVASADSNLKKIFQEPVVNWVQHYFIAPPSLLADHGFASRMNGLVNRTQGSHKTLAVCESKLRLIHIQNCDFVLQIHRDSIDASTDLRGDSLIEPLGQLIDKITQENCNERFITVLYLFVNKPNDVDQLDDFISRWRMYLSLKQITVKLVFVGEVSKDVCKLKSYLQTLPTKSHSYFFKAESKTDLEDILDTVADEVEYEQSRSAHSSVQLAVSYPLGVIGEGFLKSVALQPTWDVHTNAHCLFQGAPPEFVTQSGAVYRTEIVVSPDSEDLDHFSTCVFTLLAAYQAYMFRSPERIASSGRNIERMAQKLLEWINKTETAPSTLRGLRYKLSGFLSTMEAFGGVTFHGKWYTKLREMKFGKQLSRRVVKEFDLETVKKGVPFENLKRIKEPSDALFFANRTGRLIRVRTVNSSQIEPWLINVAYVSFDTEGSTLKMFRAAEEGVKVQDSRGRHVSDVLLLDVDVKDEIAKLYYGYVFTRTPYLYMPSQQPSLIVNTLTACIEKAFEVCISYHEQVEAERKPETIAKVRGNLQIAMDLVEHVQRLMNTEGSSELIEGIFKNEDFGVLFTTQFDIQSVNQVLAALMLPKAAKLIQSDRWPRVCFGVLAEAVMRNCRARVRSGKKTAEELIDKALLIRHPDDTIDYNLNVKKSCRATNGAMLHSFTNCSPFKAVAVLFFVKFLHQNRRIDDIVKAFVCGEASMANFLHANLPGRGSSITQLALYLQGLYRMKVKYRQDIRFENPRAIVDEIVQVRLQHYHVQRLREHRKGDLTRYRRRIRLAEAATFRQFHAGHPTLFSASEVEVLNKQRPPNDHLQLMQTGLLTHHCCYPHCPHYLQNFQTEKDKKCGTRNGFMHHLTADMLIGQYAKGWHVQCRRMIRKCTSEEEFCSAMARHFPSLPDSELFAKAQYEQYKELMKKG